MVYTTHIAEYIVTLKLYTYTCHIYTTHIHYIIYTTLHYTYTIHIPDSSLASSRAAGSLYWAMSLRNVRTKIMPIVYIRVRGVCT